MKYDKDEQWKDITGYEGIYQVSNTGLVKSLPRQVWNGWAMVSTEEKLLKPNTLAKGYYQVTLNKQHKRKCFQVHRLVAQAFIPNPEGYDQVNHINGVKDDNRVENIEWCNNSMNQIHAYRTKLRIHTGNEGRPKRPIVLKNKFRELHFDSLSSAWRYFGETSGANLSKFLRGKAKSYRGFTAYEYV